MVDTTTSFLALIKQTIGGNRNTWGNILNDNMDRVDDGIAGRHAVATTGGTTTLAAAEWAKRIIEVTGVLISAATLVFPNKSGFWIVRNGTTGSFALSCKTASGASVALTQGGWNIVWCDGSNVMRSGPSSLMFSDQFLAPDGTMALPGVSFTSDPDTGIRHAGYASGSLLSNPFTMVNNSATVTVSHTAHGLASNDFAAFSGATAAQGITIDGLYQVTVVNASAYTIVHSAQATGNGSGGGTPAYKYMKAAPTGNAFSLTSAGADVAHVSPYGVINFGSKYITGDNKVSGKLDVGGNFTAGGTGIISGILSLLSTSCMKLAKGNTAQRPSVPVQGDFRFNTQLGVAGLPEAYDGSNWLPMLVSLSGAQMPYGAILNGTISVTPNSPVANANTIALKTLAGTDPSPADPVVVVFRNPTSSNGGSVFRQVIAPLSLVLSSGSDMGVRANGVPFKLWLTLIDDAGSVRIGAVNTLNGSSPDIYPLGQFARLAASVAEGGAGGADSAHVMYTDVAVANKAYVPLGYLSYENGLSPIGSWATGPTRIQLYGAGVPLPGAVIQNAWFQDATKVLINSTTKIATTLVQAITPTSNANIFKVTAQGYVRMTAAGDIARFNIYRNNGAVMVGSETRVFGNSATATGGAVACLAFDFPASANWPPSQYSLYGELNTGGSGTNAFLDDQNFSATAGTGLIGVEEIMT